MDSRCPDVGISIGSFLFQPSISQFHYSINRRLLIMKELLKIGIIFSLFFFFTATTPAIAAELSEFYEIHSSVSEDYSTYALKFTYL